MSQIQLFAQLAKVDEAKRQVTGIIASESPDAANEVFDYDSSKANFEAWSGNVAKASGGKSVGNLRAMHGNVAAGTIAEIIFDDMAKTISVVADVVDDNEWQKCLKGVYTGFSIGGSYVKKWADAVNKSLKRYTAMPAEVSLVDVGCNPDACFMMVKADGMQSEVKFGDTVNGLMHKMQDATTTADELPVLVKRLQKALSGVVGEPDDAEELAKGSWSISELASAASQAEYIATGYGCNIDGTPRAFTDDVKKAAGLLYDALAKMVNEDIAAAKDRLKGIKKKYDEESAEPLAKALAVNSTMSTTVDNMVKALGCETSEAAMEKISALTTEGEALKKSVTDLTKERDDVKSELEKVKGEPAAAKGVKSVVVGKEEDGLNKSADSGSGNAEEVRDPLALMKMAQARPMQIGLPSRPNQNGG